MDSDKHRRTNGNDGAPAVATVQPVSTCRRIFEPKLNTRLRVMMIRKPTDGVVYSRMTTLVCQVVNQQDGYNRSSSSSATAASPAKKTPGGVSVVEAPTLKLEREGWNESE